MPSYAAHWLNQPSLVVQVGRQRDEGRRACLEDQVDMGLGRLYRPAPEDLGPALVTWLCCRCAKSNPSCDVTTPNNQPGKG